MTLQEYVVSSLLHTMLPSLPKQAEVMLDGAKMKYIGLSGRFVSLYYSHHLCLWFLDWDDQDGSTGHQNVSSTDTRIVVARFVALVKSIHGGCA